MDSVNEFDGWSVETQWHCHSGCGSGIFLACICSVIDVSYIDIIQ